MTTGSPAGQSHKSRRRRSRPRTRWNAKWSPSRNNNKSCRMKTIPHMVVTGSSVALRARAEAANHKLGKSKMPRCSTNKKEVARLSRRARVERATTPLMRAPSSRRRSLKRRRSPLMRPRSDRPATTISRATRFGIRTLALRTRKKAKHSQISRRSYGSSRRRQPLQTTLCTTR